MATDFPKKGDDKKITLRNSNYKQFDYSYARDLRENYPSIWRKGGNIRGNSAFTNWGKARKGELTKAVTDWIKEREAWAARHLDNSRVAGVVAQIKWGVVGSRGMSYMKQLINEEKKKLRDKTSKGYKKKPKNNKAESGDLKIGDYCRWKASGGTARGRIIRMTNNGKLKVPGTSFSVLGTADNPAALLQIYRSSGDGYEATDKYAGHKFSTLTKIKPLKKPSKDSTKKAANAVAEVESKGVKISKIDEDERVVYGVVYAPYELDSHGEMMLPNDIETMARRFMQIEKLDQTIDTNHDNVPNGSYPIESFVARDNDPDYPEGAWVLGVKVEDDSVWRLVKSGELNGFSFQALVRKLPAVVEVEVNPQQTGVTESSNGHTHLFFVEINPDGRIVRGRTTTDNGHAHDIVAGTATSEENGHSHRIFV